jgi:hypothetical protein
VSGGTINRLLATMHQNGFADKSRPSFPHSVKVPVGVRQQIDGVRGTALAQVGTPRVELIDGSTDRFWLEVDIRARYRPDAGTQPLPAYINGTIRAQYRIVGIDPNCLGWSKKKAGEHLWVRVVKNSVQFRGTTDEEPTSGPVYIGAPQDQAATATTITRQAVLLLATSFAAAPHRMSPDFRPGLLRSLVPAPDNSAIVAAVSVAGDPVGSILPAGSIASVTTVVLDGADFGIAVSSDAIKALAEPAIAPLRLYQARVPIHIPLPSPFPHIRDTYQVTVDPPDVQWYGFGSFGLLKVKVSGHATALVAPNATFDVEQDITVTFDGGAEKLSLAVGSRHVTVDAKGPFGSLAEPTIRDRIDAGVKAVVEVAVKNAQPSVDGVIGRKQELIKQLQTFDQFGGARIDSAGFVADGAVLRGRISFSRRKGPVILFETTVEQDGLTALQTWIPGGRVDRFEWNWVWHLPNRPPGSAVLFDRFVLRRPPGPAGPLGAEIQLLQRLPGLNGPGKVCLRIHGVQVDPVTGEVRQIPPARLCQNFGVLIPAKHRDVQHLFAPDLPELSRDVPFPQLALIDLHSPIRPPTSANTLVLYADDAGLQEVGSALREGLERVRRPDGRFGLLVIVPEGQLARMRGGSVADVDSVCEELGLALSLAEDMRGHWAAAFEMRGSGQAWRLLDPEGNMVWKHDGRIPGEALASALNQHLVLSGTPKFDMISPSPIVGVGKHVDSDYLRPDPLQEIDGDCPPFQLGGVSVGTIVTFVEPASDASETQLRRLAAEHQRSGGEAPALMVVVRGADRGAAEANRRRHPRDLV